LTIWWRESSLGERAERDEHRAALAAECNAATGGRQRPRRRQPRLAAQAALVWLTDVAHNRLAWSRGWRFRHAPVAEAGIDRRVNELVPIPGQVRGEAGPIVKWRLKASHPLAKPMLACLTRVCERCCTPRILRKIWF
jgi:hypothetical protein